MTEMQTKLLEMFTWLVDYLKETGCTYYVLYGTTLGAARHEGFIPWDDDIDIGIPRPEYIKFMETFKGNSRYRLETPYDDNSDYLYTFSKLYDTETTLVERLRHNVKRGIFIDIFPLDGIGNTYDEALANLKRMDRRNMFLMTRTCAIRKQRTWYKNLAIIISRCIPFFDEKKYSLKYDRLAAEKNYDECKYVANLSGAYREREIIEKSILGKPTDMKFETINVACPEHTDEYLTGIYHDWRKLPPEDKRGVQHDFVSLDFNKSYLE